MTAKKTAKKAPAKKRAAAQKKATNATSMTTVEEPPVPDPDRAPQADPRMKLRRAERGNGAGEDPNAVPPGEDKIYGIASRDRWAGAGEVSELNNDAADIDQQVAENAGE